MVAQVITATDSINVRLHGDSPSRAQLWLPSIIAIAVVVLGGVIQWRIASRQWKEQRGALDKQLDAQRQLAEKQLEAQRELTEKQIDASLRASARLRWIGSVRTLAGDLVVSASRVTTTLALLQSWKELSRENKGDKFYMEKVDKYQNALIPRQLTLRRLSQHLRLHLDPNEPFQQVLSEAVQKLERKAGELTTVHPDADLPVDFATSMGRLHGEVEAATISLIRHYSRGIQTNPGVGVGATDMHS